MLALENFVFVYFRWQMCDETIPCMPIAYTRNRAKRHANLFPVCIFHNNEKLNIKYMMTVVASVWVSLATEFPSGVNVSVSVCYIE